MKRHVKNDVCMATNFSSPLSFVSIHTKTSRRSPGHEKTFKNATFRDFERFRDTFGNIFGSSGGRLGELLFNICHALLVAAQLNLV